MVYVVERYLPGLSRSDLLHGLSRLERAMADSDGVPAVRYLGSTIVLGDDACFCQFEGPSEAAVADANTQAGLSFDRIVPAVNVTPTKGDAHMTVSASTPTTIQIRRSRLIGLLAFVATVAAAITWAVQAFAPNEGPSALPQNTPTADAVAVEQFANGTANIARAQQDAAALYANPIRSIRSIMDLTPGDLAGGGVWGYVVPSRQTDTLEEVLASMSPESRRYVTTIMGLTFRELAHGAAGSP
jgi:uncharacterized protein DUF4242